MQLCLKESKSSEHIREQAKVMHDTALDHGKRFFDAYVKITRDLTIVDIGAQDINGSLRAVAPPNNNYIGVDFVEAKGVDIVITDPYSLPFEDDSVDVCVCSSCFEHSEFFWLLYNEILRILKPAGIFYLNAPSNGSFHRYPVDCWRFYPDSGKALQNWGRRNGYNAVLLESFTGALSSDLFNDFVAVFLKDEEYVQRYPERIQDNLPTFTNGLRYGHAEFSAHPSLHVDRRTKTKFHKAIEAQLLRIMKMFSS